MKKIYLITAFIMIVICNQVNAQNLLGDPSFDESTNPGGFPNSGYWNDSHYPAESGAVLVGDYFNSPPYSLHVYTDDDSNYHAWSAPYQDDISCCPGRIYQGSAFICTPSEFSWQPGSEAFIKISFRDIYHSEIIQYESPHYVSSYPVWESYELITPSAPDGTEYVRFIIYLERPYGIVGQSIINVDDCYLEELPTPDIYISPDSLNFGSLPIGEIITDTLVITNIGTDVLTISNISSDNDDFEINITNFNLNPDESQDVLVSFSPSSIGEIEGSLTVFSNDPDEPTVTVPLIGEGLITGDINFTSVPAWSSFDDLYGQVSNADSSFYKVAVYIFVEPAGGWWTKPYAADPLTTIMGDGSWITDITTGGIDEYATSIIAFLLPNGFDITNYICGPDSACSTLPDTLFNYPYAIECRKPGTRTISFAGYDWIVKKSYEITDSIGPGPNNFSDSNENVFVDEDGLHLKITQEGEDWVCSEVIAEQSFGYGTYTFEVNSRIDLLDENIVVGLFTWDDFSPFSLDNQNEYYREIDIEFSKWSDPQNPYNAQFVVQPHDIPENLFPFYIQLSDDDSLSTHIFTWNEESIDFQSIYDNTVVSWCYSGDNIPVPGIESPRINFWLFNGNAPANNQEAEIVISIVDTIPVSNDNTIPIGKTNLINYPNPFNPETVISFSLPQNSKVEVSIYNIKGQKVKNIINDNLIKGKHNLVWDGKDESGKPVPSGIYFFKMESENFSEIRKCVLLK